MSESKYVRMQSPRLQALMDGTLDVADLDDEELARGYPRNKNGNFAGRPPNVIPRVMQDEIMRRLLSRGTEVFKEAYIDSLQAFSAIARDTNADPNVRLKAAQYVIERLTGKVPERVHIAAEDPVETLFKNILADPTGLFEKDPVPEEPGGRELVPSKTGYGPTADTIADEVARDETMPMPVEF